MHFLFSLHSDASACCEGIFYIFASSSRTWCLWHWRDLRWRLLRHWRRNYCSINAIINIRPFRVEGCFQELSQILLLLNVWGYIARKTLHFLRGFYTTKGGTKPLFLSGLQVESLLTSIGGTKSFSYPRVLSLSAPPTKVPANFLFASLDNLGQTSVYTDNGQSRANLIVFGRRLLKAYYVMIA